MKFENTRHLTIIKTLIEEETITSEKLALLTFSSVRTIKNDLSYLKEVLDKEGIVRIKATQSKGFQLEVLDNFNFGKFKNEVYSLYSLFSIDTIENLNRRLYILKKLFINEYILIEDIAEELHLSRNALSRDIKKAESFLRSYQIEVYSIPGKGLTLRGEEIYIRMAMIETLCSQYHNFTPLYPVWQFNKKFYNIREEYDDLRHDVLKLMRQSKISLSDISSKRLATYLALVKNGNRPFGNEICGLNQYILDLSQQILKQLIPEKINDYEVTALAMLLQVYCDYDLREDTSFFDDQALLEENRVALNKIIQKSLLVIKNPYLDSSLFEPFRIEFESALLSITMKKKFNVLSHEHLTYYNNRSENFVEPIALQFTRVFVQTIEELIGESLKHEISIPIAQLFHYLMESQEFPYKKRSVAVISYDSKYAGEAMRKSVLLRYGNVFENVDIFNQYELRKVDFSNYDAALTSVSIAEAYNAYPIPFVNYHTPLNDVVKNHMFQNIFIHGFDRSIYEWFVAHSSFHLSNTMEGYENYVNALIFRYGNDDTSCKLIADKITNDNRILEHYYCSSGISVIWFDPSFVDHEFIDFYVPKKFAISKNGCRIRGVIALSVNTDIPAYKLKVVDQMLYTFANDYRLIEKMSKNIEKVIEEVYRIVCFQLLDDLH